MMKPPEIIETWYEGRRVVCAACRFFGELIICAPRHYDATMRAAIDLITGPYSSANVEQGFVDQKGIFLNRCEAWHIAYMSNQIIRQVGSDHLYGGYLFSENLY